MAGRLSEVSWNCHRRILKLQFQPLSPAFLAYVHSLELQPRGHVHSIALSFVSFALEIGADQAGLRRCACQP